MAKTVQIISGVSPTPPSLSPAPEPVGLRIERKLFSSQGTDIEHWD